MLLAELKIAVKQLKFLGEMEKCGTNTAFRKCTMEIDICHTISFHLFTKFLFSFL